VAESGKYGGLEKGRKKKASNERREKMTRKLGRVKDWKQKQRGSNKEF
jgi:hypothetical protein